MSTDANTNRAYAQWLADAFKEVDWPIPPYLQLGGFLSPLAKAIKDAPTQDAKLEITRERLAGAYTGDYLASMFLSRYSTILHVRDFKRQIDESIRTYFCGWSDIAILAGGDFADDAFNHWQKTGNGFKGVAICLAGLICFGMICVATTTEKQPCPRRGDDVQNQCA